MRNLFTDFRVGLFVIATVALVVFGYFWSYDGVKRGEGSYALFLTVPSADGMWRGTPVKVAGVDVGSIQNIQIRGGSAEIELWIRAVYELPVDSEAEIKASGLLGDRFVVVYPGTDPALLEDRDRLRLRSNPADLDQITRNVQVITEDLQAVTAVLREMAENDDNRLAIEATLGNVEALTAEFRSLAARNSDDIDAIVAATLRLSENLEAISSETGQDLDEEMEKIKQVTDTLQSSMDDLESITGKIDRGEGTIGALVNDEETIDALNDTIYNANEVIQGFSGLRAQVYYTGRLYFGTQPTDPQFYAGNPLHGTGANTIGIRLMPHEHFWWVFEVVDYPTGTVTRTERFLPEFDEVHIEYVQEPKYRFTFMMEKRWGWLSLRLGVKENGGGIGATAYFLDDRLSVAADAFDFEFGSYPAIDARGLPNTRLALRAEPVHHVYVEAGAEQLLLGARYDYATGFVGAGFYFHDDDIKLLLATLPLNL